MLPAQGRAVAVSGKGRQLGNRRVFGLRRMNRRRSGVPPQPLLQECRVRRGEHALVVRVHVACEARCMCMRVRLGEVLEEPLGLLRLALGLRRRKRVSK